MRPSRRTKANTGLSGAKGKARLAIVVLRMDALTTEVARCFRLESREPILIGRVSEEGDPDGLRSPTELRLQDGFVSGAHATIRHEGGFDTLVDGGSRNGCFVNGKPISEHPLADGDLCELGHTLLVYRHVDEELANAIDPDGVRFGPTRTICPELAAVALILERIAVTREPVLVLGETGAGKEIAARALHDLSGRRGELRVVDCGAVPESLFESTLFGHQRGAFTGASEARVGELVRADGGTLFLDEIGNTSPAVQAKLLRVLEDGCVTPLGAAEPVRVDVRVVAATNRELVSDGADGFRSDLFRRLAGCVIRLPPLRRRREDLGLLTAHLLREAGASTTRIRVGAARALYGGSFPGNVRELRAALRSAAALAKDGAIDLAHLPGELTGEHAAAAAQVAPDLAAPGAAVALRRTMPEPATIEHALRETQGNVVHAAQLLGTSARQLYRWAERLGLDPGSFRQG